MKLGNLFYQRQTPTGWENYKPVTLSTLLILEAAEELGVKWHILPGTNFIELEYQGIKKYFRYQLSTETTLIGYQACQNKMYTNELLRAAGIQVPVGFAIAPTDSQEQWMEIYQALQKPLVVKPTNGTQGQSVFLGIDSPEKFIAAVEKAMNFSSASDKERGVEVEETFKGKEYRILATKEKVIGILNRRPANVVGDGKATIQQLIEEKNRDPRRGTDDTYALFQIQIDDDVRETLALQNLSLDSVPAADERISVRRVSNIARGGDSIDVTDIAHPSVSEIAVRAMQAMPGLAFAGIDFMTEDIAAPQTDSSYKIIEINSSPGFCIQVFPAEGKPRLAQYEFLKLAFPNLKI